VKLTTFLDVFGAAALAGFAFFIWPPAALLVVGAALLFASWRAS
jgi:hypothetical protein